MNEIEKQQAAAIIQQLSSSYLRDSLYKYEMEKIMALYYGTGPTHAEMIAQAKVEIAEQEEKLNQLKLKLINMELTK